MFAFCLVAASSSAGQPIEIRKEVSAPGLTPPIYVSMSGFTGEAAQVLRFDLYVQGFAFTNAEAAQYLISGSNNGNLEGKVTDPHNQEHHRPAEGLFRRGAAAAGPCVRR